MAAVELESNTETRGDWVRGLGVAAAVCAVASIFVSCLALARLLETGEAVPVALLLGGLAALAGAAALAAWSVRRSFAGRLDLLRQALEASSDAQIVVGPSGQDAYANAAFSTLFPDASSNSLDALAASIADIP